MPLPDPTVDAHRGAGAGDPAPYHAPGQPAFRYGDGREKRRPEPAGPADPASPRGRAEWAAFQLRLATLKNDTAMMSYWQTRLSVARRDEVLAAKGGGV